MLVPQELGAEGAQRCPILRRNLSRGKHRHWIESSRCKKPMTILKTVIIVIVFIVVIIAVIILIVAFIILIIVII